MANPQYILLTVKRVTNLTDERGRMLNPAQIRILQPPLRQLFILPVSFSEAGNGTQAAELQQGAQVLTFAESFEDVLEAIDRAALDGLAIARPVNVEGLRDAITQSRGFPMPSPAGAIMGNVPASELEATRARLADRQAEGAKHQDELVVQPSDDDGAKIDAAFEKHKTTPPDNDGARWDDFPVPGTRQPQAGDLRIVELSINGRFWIEICVRDFDDESSKEVFEWSRAGVPGELLAVHETRNAAQLAVKLAGYSRRLIED
jgi:hypothetical protein